MRETIYLAHPISAPMTSGQSRSLNSWVSQTKAFCKKMRIKVLDPSRFSMKEKTSSPDEIVCRNVVDILNSNAVVAYCCIPSHGVGGEIVTAKALSIPVVSFITPGKASAWILYHSTYAWNTSAFQELILKAVGVI